MIYARQILRAAASRLCHTDHEALVRKAFAAGEAFGKEYYAKRLADVREALARAQGQVLQLAGEAAKYRHRLEQLAGLA